MCDVLELEALTHNNVELDMHHMNVVMTYNITYTIPNEKMSC